jgi:hypothetical protein
MLLSSRQRTVSHFLFHHGISDQNKKVFVLHPPYFSISRLKMKLKGRQFDTIEVIEAESQAVLYTLTENDFQHALKKWLKLWER